MAPRHSYYIVKDAIFTENLQSYFEIAFGSLEKIEVTPDFRTASEVAVRRTLN